MSYSKHLEEIGIAKSRHFGLQLAMAQLHSELCKLDLHNRRLFLSKGIDGEMAEFACCEQLANPVAEHYSERLENCYNRIDTEDEVDMVLEKLHELRVATEEFAEVRLPGTGNCMASIEDLINLINERKK